jgi:hypothetical protein
MNEEVVVSTPMAKRKRRPNATAAEKMDWAKRFAESGLGQREFCQQQGLGLTTLQRWLAQAEGSSELEARPDFTEVKLAVPLSAPRWAAELCRPDGLRLRLAHDVPPGLVEHLMRLC